VREDFLVPVPDAIEESREVNARIEALPESIARLALESVVEFVCRTVTS
jgi:hypothetical protein